MVQLIYSFRQASLKKQGFVTLACLMLYFLTSYILENSYAQSKFPVPYFVQQTSFDAAKMKTWYGYMLAQNTMDIYLKTQFLDFAFIASVILGGFTLWTFVANLHSKDSFFHRIGNKMAFSLPIAGVFDVLENIVSFFMIAHPVNFADNIVVPYSLFASLKFGFWTIGLLWLPISIIGFLFKKVTAYSLIKE